MAAGTGSDVIGGAIGDIPPRFKRGALSVRDPTLLAFSRMATSNSSINDTYGHPVGDAVLKVVASRCSEVLRDGDLFARFGGEEFIGLLTITTEHEAAVIAERLRNAIADAPVLIGQLAIAVSGSVGAATMKMTSATSRQVLEDLIERADAALYRAKQSGRNRVIIA